MALVQMLAITLIPAGYRWYVIGRIPRGKDPTRVDEKIVSHYELDLTRHQIAHRKRKGHAAVRYLRCQRTFVMIATGPHGGHKWFREEGRAVRDIRATPLLYVGYSIGSKKTRSRGGLERWRSHVTISRDRFEGLRARFLDIATQRSAEKLRQEFAAIPFEPYGPVILRLLRILSEVNMRRKRAGFETLGYGTLRYRRRVVKVFVEDDESSKSLAAV